MKGYIQTLICFFACVLFCSYPVFAGGLSTLKNEPTSWYEGGKRKKAWRAINEAAVFVPRDTYKKNNAISKIAERFPGASIKGISGNVIYLQRKPLKGSKDLTQKIKETNPFQKTSPVFYRSFSAGEETRMVLTGEIILRFDPDMTLETIKGIEDRYGLIRLRSFAFDKNVFIYDAGDPLGSLSLVEEIHESGEACYATPNWIIACSKRAIPDDPLFVEQWHLLNADYVGEDVNIITVWDTYLGTHDEVIAIVDDGLEIDHKDLKDNVLNAYCWDFVDSDIDPTAGDHGTCCAGVAAGRGDNGIGICSAAPQAGLVGHRLFNDYWEASYESIAGSLTQNNQTIDIYSNSWGPDDGGYYLDDMNPLVADAIASGVTSGRGGLGSIYVWSAGNGSDADNSNYDAYANSRYTIAVSASDNQGFRYYYSEKGANILVNAPGTSIYTTDINNGYKSGFSGTSASAPLVAGIIALILQANPDLTWRDVQHVLMETAYKNDGDWDDNGAGYSVSYEYGFGRIDAQAAVTAAETWTNAAPEVSVQQTSSPDIAIPDNDPTGVIDTINIDEKIVIESVEVVFNASDHDYWPDLNVTLTSPDGTDSVLADTHNPTNTPIGYYNSWKFCTLRHYKEVSKGDWTLTVKDGKASNTGTFESWSINIYGTDTTAPFISDLSEPPIDITDNTATITWNTDEPSTGIVRYGTESAAWTGYPLEIAGTSLAMSHSITIEGLVDNTTYYLQAGSVDAAGNGPDQNPGDTNPSAEITFTTGSDAPVISGLVTALAAETLARITWTTDEPSDSMICYSTTSGLNWNHPSMAAVSDPAMTTSHSITIEGLDTEQTYYYLAGSTDAAGNGPEQNSNATNPTTERSFTTTYNAPVITGLGVNSYTETTATITWTTNEASDSVIQYSTTSSNWTGYTFTESDTAMVTSHSITLTNLAEDTRYYYRAGSTDSSGSGPENYSNATNPSDELSFTTGPKYPSVTGFPAIDFTASTISIRFDKSNMQGTFAESGYSFSPTLLFRTQGGSDDIEYTGNNTYLLHLASIPHYIIYTLTMDTITDTNGHHLTNDTVTINDNDMDAMADDWEDHYDIEYAHEDPDDDGLSNALEFAAGAYPDDADSDNDGLPDGWEYDTGLDPADATGDNGTNGDPDNDGWSNYEEYANNTDPADDSSPAPTPPEIMEVHPHDNAGIDDVSRIPSNTSFSVRVADEDGIDITDVTSIAFTIDDGTNPAYEATLDDAVVRVVKLSQDSDTMVKSLWAVYDRSLEEGLGDYPFDTIVNIVFEVKDIRGDPIEPASYTFAVETEDEHDEALLESPPWTIITQGDSRIVGMYDTGIIITDTESIYAAIIYNSTEPLPPGFGPTFEIPSIDIPGANSVGVPINIHPPTVFNIPPKVYIPCPGYTDPTVLNVYGYNGSEWVSICNSSGIVSADAQGWMVEGSRVDHAGSDPATIEVRLYHCSGIVAGKSEADTDDPDYSSGSSSCFIGISKSP